jgi:tetratricopeptide (TPR) repeat protein
MKPSSAARAILLVGIVPFAACGRASENSAASLTTDMPALVAGQAEARSLHGAEMNGRSMLRHYKTQIATPASPFAGIEQQTDRQAESVSPETELRVGIDLTRQGKFAEAIPHFLAARGHVSDSYAAEFNLALCYVGSGEFSSAISVLKPLSGSHNSAAVQNLLAQAHIGNNQPQEAMAALRQAAALTPNDEKLYAFVADACADHEQYALGVEVVDLGLQHLPSSARLHFQRGHFLSPLDQQEAAFAEFDNGSRLAPGGEIGYLSVAEKNFLQGNLPEAIRVAREATNKGRENFLLLGLLGEALIRSGVLPGQPDFAEAEAALEKSVAQKPGYAIARISLAYCLLQENRLQDAIQQLETARALNPRNPAVYSRLAIAYRREGKIAEADEATRALARLNAEEAARINSAPGETKAIPGGTPRASDRPN